MGVLKTRLTSATSSRVEYRLTDKGRAFFPHVLVIPDWGGRWFRASEGPATMLTHTSCGGQFRPVLHYSACGTQRTSDLNSGRAFAQLKEQVPRLGARPGSVRRAGGRRHPLRRHCGPEGAPPYPRSRCPSRHPVRPPPCPHRTRPWSLQGAASAVRAMVSCATNAPTPGKTAGKQANRAAKQAQNA